MSEDPVRVRLAEPGCRGRLRAKPSFYCSLRLSIFARLLKCLAVSNLDWPCSCERMSRGLRSQLWREMPPPTPTMIWLSLGELDSSSLFASSVPSQRKMATRIIRKIELLSLSGQKPHESHYSYGGKISSAGPRFCQLCGTSFYFEALSHWSAFSKTQCRMRGQGGD